MSDLNQRLFNYMKEEHGVTLLESDINEIKLICAEEGQSEQLVGAVSGSLLIEKANELIPDGTSHENLIEIKQVLFSNDR